MNIVWGAIIILVGVFLLLLTTDIVDIDINASWLFGGLFFLAFIFFMGVYFAMRREQFWPLIPGIIMLGLSLLILRDEIGLSSMNQAGVFMLFIGLSFLAVYVFHPDHWWAVIPAGIVASVSLVIFFGNLGLMFLGMGLTFIALYFVLLGTPDKHWWPLIPGSILGFMGILFLYFGHIELGNYILPLVLIIVGIVLIVKSWKKKRLIG